MKQADYSISFNPFVYAAIPSKTECLDIGCSAGSLGKALIKEKNCVVDGIDFQADVLKQAKKNGYRNTLSINFNNDVYSLKGIGKYDIIICADVLEHLIDPVMVLRELKKHLRPDGKIIISLPNIGFLLYRIQHMFGKWEYREFGTLDKTHLRFYTISSGRHMVEASGFIVVAVKPYNQFGILRYIKPLDQILPSLFAYQFLITAQ